MHDATIQHAHHAKALVGRHVQGPSSVNTAEITIVHSRLKRATELGIEPAPIVPIDRNVPQRTKSCARLSPLRCRQQS